MIYLDEKDIMDIIYFLIGVGSLYIIYLILKKVLKNNRS